LSEADGSQDIDDTGGQFGGVVFEAKGGGGVEGSGVVEIDVIRVISRGSAFDGVDSAEHPPAWLAAEEQTGAQAHVPDQLPRHDQVAAGRAEQVGGIAKLAVLSLVCDMKDSFHVSIVHLGSKLSRSWPLVIETPAMRVVYPRGSLKMHDERETL
jgi:hypothetical protein